MSRLKIAIDDCIPYIKGVLEPYADVVYAPPQNFTSDLVHDADALIVRTRTHCNADLLAGSSVRFIATATIGFDHIDTEFCEQNSIAWTNAPGCNASSVAQYIGSVLANYSLKRNKDLSQLTLGIVGVGHVGTQVLKMANLLGMNVLLNDPIRAKQEPQNQFVTLNKVAECCDVITFHTPLTHNGAYATYHMGNSDFFAQCKRQPLVINAARGGVVDEAALLEAYSTGKVSAFALDCWENEPKISAEMLENAFVATPHIAGYSADGKANATQMSVRAVSRFFNLGLDYFSVTELPPKTSVTCLRTELPTKILQNYDVMSDDHLLREQPENFEALRGHYRIRREQDFRLEVNG